MRPPTIPIKFVLFMASILVVQSSSSPFRIRKSNRGLLMRLYPRRDYSKISGIEKRSITTCKAFPPAISIRWFNPIRNTAIRICESLQGGVFGRISDCLFKGIQVSLVVYICYEMFIAIKDIIKEIQEEHVGDLQVGSILGVSSSEPKLMSPVAASKLALWLQAQSSTTCDLEVEGVAGGSFSPQLPRSVPSTAVQLARQLHQSGVPLLESETATSPKTSTSVETILSQLTRRQADMLLSCLVAPDPSLSLTESIAGLDAIRQSLLHWIHRRDLYDRWAKQPMEDQLSDDLTPFEHFVQAASPTSSHSISPHKGIFLYGPPGCGKSLLIQALSSDACLPTLVVTPATLQRKWYGDTNRQVRHLFEVLDIVRPCILVLDELDGIFRERQSDEHEASRSMKTEFLNCWQGSFNRQMNMDSTENDRRAMLVVGASNRPFDVDPAVLRRLPTSYFIGLPSLQDRRDMLWKWAGKHGLLPYVQDDLYDSTSPSSVLETMAYATHFYSPSDLWQALQTACLMGPVARGDFELTEEDVWNGLSHVPPTRLSNQYVHQLQQFGARPQSQRVSQPGSTGWADWTRVPLSTESTFQDQQRYQQRDSIWKLESEDGNFYHLGHVPVDSETMEELMRVLASLGSGYFEDSDSQDDLWLDELSSDDDSSDDEDFVSDYDDNEL